MHAPEAVLLRFDETPTSLKTRIDAYRRFATFDLNAWLGSQIPIQQGDTVLDLGCGEGNHLKIWAGRVGTAGRVWGLDKSLELLREAQRHLDLCSNVGLMCADMEQRLPLRSHMASWVIACFSIYYVQTAESVLSEIVRILTTDGGVVLTGPTRNNAHELYEFHQRITGIGMTPQAQARTARLQEEFLPLAQSVFAEVKTTLLDNALVFPTADEFVDYYRSTPLFAESQQRNISEAWLLAMASRLPTLTIKKETIVIQARKPHA